MKIQFCGASSGVTGSCHLITTEKHKILLDCGQFQGGKAQEALNYEEFPFDPAEIEYMVLSHAHIDHCGRIPLLIKRGFKGSIYCTDATADLLDVMLKDSGYIHEKEAQWKNKKNERAGRPLVEPLYTYNDAVDSLKYVKPVLYDQLIELNDEMKIVFNDAGHILGSAITELWVTEGDSVSKIVFSGDLGVKDRPILRDPTIIKKADYVIMESTYGNRNHTEVWSYTDDLAKIIDETMAKGGNVVIPAFAVGRTQELLYFIREIKDKGLVKSNPDFPVYIDSPLARRATTIFTGDLDGYLDADALALVQDGTHMFNFSNLRMTETVEESKGLNEDGIPKVIISASGMCDAGRIRHHLKHNLWRPECAVVFVGYQAEGSLGRRLLNGVGSVKLFGEEIAVRARIVNFHGLSSHADRDGLLRWIEHFSPRPRQVFVVHGDQEVTEVYANTLREKGLAAHAPNYEEVYDLLDNRMLSPGLPPEKKPEPASGGSPAYQRLEDVGRRLMEVIAHNKGGTNKDLGRFADQLRALIEKWDR